MECVQSFTGGVINRHERYVVTVVMSRSGSARNAGMTYYD